MAATDLSSHLGSAGLPTRGVVAVGLAVVVNLLVVFATTASGAVAPFTHLAYGRVAVFTAVGAVGATAVYGLFRRYRDRPDRDFAIVAAVVLVVSWVPDVAFIPTLPGATTGAVVVLMALHLTTAAVCYAVLTR